MGDELVVREATIDDAAAITRVHTRSWQGAYAHIFLAERLRQLDDLESRRTETWRGWLGEPVARLHTLVAVLDGEVIGFVQGGPARDDDLDASRVAELLAIYVVPDSWGAGAGRALMTAHLEQLRKSGFSEAVLWVLDDNPRARRFYELAGWSTDGATKEDEFLDTRVREVRYRIALD